MIDTAYLYDQSECILTYFGVFVTDPLAGEFSKLLVISANDHLERLVNQIFFGFNV